VAVGKVIAAVGGVAAAGFVAAALALCMRRGVPSVGAPPDASPAVVFASAETARYELRVGGVVAATCEITIGPARFDDRACVAARYRVTSSEAASAIKPFTLGGHTVMDAASLLPWRSEKWSVKPDKEKRTLVVFDRAGNVATVTKTYSYKPERIEEIPFETGLDVLSALVRLRAERPEPGRPWRFELLNGDDRHEVGIERRGDCRLAVAAGSFDAVELAVTTRKLSDSADEAPGPRRSFRLWVARDSWLPLKFDAALLLGSGVGELVACEPGADDGSSHADGPDAS